MTETPQPTSGSLAAKIIRKCPVHETCSLKCPRRPFEDLGEIASFSTDVEPEQQDRSWRQKFAGWIASFSQSSSGGTPS